jgi:hypothetical protein
MGFSHVLARYLSKKLTENIDVVAVPFDCILVDTCEQRVGCLLDDTFDRGWELV